MSTRASTATPYERSGRTRQKQRTRAALVEAARRLLAAGQVPTVDEAAAAADISRTTAYRYFSSQGALLLEAHPELVRASLLGDDPPPDAHSRVAQVVAELVRITVERETPLRALLRLSLEPGTHDPSELSLRRGRAMGWLEEALTPLRGRLDDDQRRALARAIRAVAGIEALVWLTDVAGLDREAAGALQRWAAAALLDGALREPPPIA